MWQKIRDFFFSSSSPHFKELVDNGATLLDVRTKQEFDSAHIQNSIHIPLDQLEGRMKEIRKLQEPIVAYCRSGRRSGIAARMMKAQGFEAYNGGGMNKLKRKLGIS
ncbi:MAG: rhodanese-like domain-containing protein [Saprospiraceae bacterium]|nr:rhodanese-like domain-containing protein [Saprospiraceae bacterium]